MRCCVRVSRSHWTWSDRWRARELCQAFVVKSYQAAKADGLFGASDNAPACEECLFPLRVSSEYASASAQLTSRCLVECSRYSVFTSINSRTYCLSAVDCVLPWPRARGGRAREIGSTVGSCRADFADRVCVDTWDLNRQSAGDVFTTGHNVVCDGPRCCLSACLGASTSGWWMVPTIVPK